MTGAKEIKVIKVNNGSHIETEDEVAEEVLLNINVNRRYYSSLVCTPMEKIELAVGHLFSEEVLSSMEDVVSVEEIDEKTVCVILKYDLQEESLGRRALTSGCGSGSIDLNILEEYSVKPIESKCKYSYNDIFSLMKDFGNMSNIFKKTGGVHSCSICTKSSIIFFSEDIGRHNALDKVIGKSILNDVKLDDKMLLTTGRISSDIALKAARAKIPIIASHSAPTDMAIDIAKAANMTVIGFVRGKRMNIYCGFERII